MQVMDSDAEGSASEAFLYFQRLCIHGFLACRKHAERIIVLIEMMQVRLQRILLLPTSAALVT